MRARRAGSQLKSVSTQDRAGGLLAGGAVMSAVIRGIGGRVLGGVPVPVALRLDERAEVGAGEEDAVSVGARADRAFAQGAS